MRQVIFPHGHPRARALEGMDYPKLTRRHERILKRAARFIEAANPEKQLPDILGRMLGIKVALKHVDTALLRSEELVQRTSETAAVIEAGNASGEKFFITADSACVAGICGLIAEQPLPSVILPRKATMPELGIFAAVTTSILQECTSGMLRVSGIPDSPASIPEKSMGPGGLWVEYALHMDTLWGRLAAVFPATMKYPVSSPHVSAARVAKRLRGVACVLQVETVVCMLELSTIKSMEKDDIVLFSSIHPDDSPFRLRAGRGGFPCRLTPDNNIEILGDFIMADHTTGQNGPDAVSASGATILQEMEVEIVVEVARTAVSAEEVVSLTRGSVVRFDRPISGPMDLRAGGKLIARGELVDIESELGFRILEVL